MSDVCSVKILSEEIADKGGQILAEKKRHPDLKDFVGFDIEVKVKGSKDK